MEQQVTRSEASESGFCVGPYRSASAPFWMSDRCDVYKGVGPKDRRVLIKRLNKAAASDPLVIEAFRGEAEALKTVSRIPVAAVPEYLDFVEENGDVALVQELVDGKPLTTPHRGENFARLRPYEVRRFLDHMLQTLREIHRLGYVHNDIKPVNILCRPTDAQRPFTLVDFQNAERRGAAGRYHQTADEAAVPPGLPVSYSAPERQTGEHGYYCSDLYSLGLLAIQLLTGAELHELSWNEMGHITLPLYPFAKDPVLERVLVTMTCHQPVKRYQDVDEVLAALTKQRTGEILDKPVEKSRTAQTIAAVVILIVLIIAGSFAWKSAVAQYCRQSIECTSR